MYKKNTHIHFIGIGGIGMSAIAQILAHQGYTVSGCDSNLHQKSIDDLTNLGCAVHQQSSSAMCSDDRFDILVYSTAIHNTHPELLYAQQHNIPTVHRSLMLAELMRTKYGIAVSGSHGKTTTSCLIAHMLITAECDPTVIVGGHLHSINNNARYGKSSLLVAEADESDRSLLQLTPALAVLTNIDLEHLETYRNLHDVTQTFNSFLQRLPFYGKAIVCIESPEVQSLLPLESRSAITYGLTHKADWSAHAITHYGDYSTYTAFFKGKEMGPVHIALPGIHNVLNSLAALATGHELGLSFKITTKALASFTGVDRRFTFKGTYQGAAIFDDYGHHPLEIKHTLETARRKTNGKIVMLFQPHRYTRTQRLWDDFVTLFATSQIDHLIITDIYAASEQPLDGVTSKELIRTIQKQNPHINATYIPLKDDFCELKIALSSNLKDGDLLLLQGAGKVNKISAHLSGQ